MRAMGKMGQKGEMEEVRRWVRWGRAASHVAPGIAAGTRSQPQHCGAKQLAGSASGRAGLRVSDVGEYRVWHAERRQQGGCWAAGRLGWVRRVAHVRQVCMRASGRMVRTRCSCSWQIINESSTIRT